MKTTIELMAQNAKYDIYKISHKHPSFEEEDAIVIKDDLFKAMQELSKTYNKKFIPHNSYEEPTNPNEIIVVYYMIHWKGIAEDIEDQRKVTNASSFVFSSWNEQLKAIEKLHQDEKKEMDSQNILTAPWTEQLKYLIQYAEMAVKERNSIIEKLEAIDKEIADVGNIESVNALLDELIIALKKLTNKPH